MNHQNCPGQEELTRFLDGCLDEARISSVEQHLSDCQACLMTIESLCSTDELLNDIRLAPQVKGVQSLTERLQTLIHCGSEPILPAGAPPDIPGYEIQTPLGRGGAGWVWCSKRDTSD